MDLNGKTGLVVGIANENSIAYHCAKIFYEAGAKLAITYVNEKAEPYVRPLAQQLQASIILPCDVEQKEQLETVVDHIRKTWGKLDFLLHSIAFAPKQDLQGRVLDCSKEGFFKAMDISCYSLIQLSRLIEPLMNQNGSIITMSYYGSQKVVRNYNVMGIVKAALESATRYLAAELGPKVRVNALSPGPIMTRAASGILDFNELLTEEVKKSALHRLVDTCSVGYMAAFLISEAAKDITGQVIYIDGGYSIMD